MFNIREIFMEDNSSYKEVETFLDSFDLKVPDNIDYTVGIYDGPKIIGTGSLGGGVIKGVAISSDYQGEGLLPKIITYLINIAIDKGISNLFVFTKLSAEPMFSELGFKRIAKADSAAVLLEWGNGLEEYLSRLKNEKVESKEASAIVINANPFTRGHRYLVEEALKRSEFLYILVVEEDKSEFPFAVRMRLVEEGVRDLERIKIIPTSNYAVSSATFPSYFTKESEVAKVQARLDLNLFREKIAPTLDIKKRFVGQEPYSQVTATYNEVMKDELSKGKIEVIEIPRLDVAGEIISASRVRDYLKKGELETLRGMLPKTSYDFLQTAEGQNIIKTKIK